MASPPEIPELQTASLLTLLTDETHGGSPLTSTGKRMIQGMNMAASLIRTGVL